MSGPSRSRRGELLYLLLAAGLRAGAFLAAGFLAAALTAGFFAAGRFAAGFFAAGFFAAGFLAAAGFAAAGLATVVSSRAAPAATLRTDAIPAMADRFDSYAWLCATTRPLVDTSVKLNLPVEPFLTTNFAGKELPPF